MNNRMNPTKQSSKSSRLKRLEHILKTTDDDVSRCQTSSRWLVQKHSTRCQRHPTRGPLENTWSVNLLKLSKDVSMMKFFFLEKLQIYTCNFSKMLSPIFSKEFVVFYRIHIFQNKSGWQLPDVFLRMCHLHLL